MDLIAFIADFDRVIDKWLAGIRRHDECYRVLAQLDGVLCPEAKVLEYGAWPGLYCVYVNVRYGAEVWAIDNWQFAAYVIPSDPEQWLRLVAAYGRPRVHAQQGDICRTDFPDKFFDVVYSLGVHEHIPDDLQALREIARVLKDDGLCSMTVDFAAQGWPFMPDMFERCYDKAAMEQLISDSPFAFVRPPDYAALAALTQGNTVQAPNEKALSILLHKKI